NAYVTVVHGSVTVIDPLSGNQNDVLGTASVGVGSNPTSFPYSHTFTGDPAGKCTTHDNTATFTIDSTSTTGSASQTVTACVGADLAVSKTAVAAYDSNIQKSVDKTRVEQACGSATFNYTVNVTESGWRVSGNITVHNPNDWEDISASVADAVTSANCTITGAAQTV